MRTNFFFGMDIGSGFKSLNSYTSGYFSAAIKLHPGYTAGVITAFYVSIICTIQLTSFIYNSNFELTFDVKFNVAFERSSAREA